MEKNQIEIVRKYLANQLTLQEKQQFQKQLEDNPALAAEVAEYATVFLAIKREGDRMLQDEFHQMAQKLLLEDTPVLQPAEVANKSKIHSLFGYSRILQLAAVMAGLLILAVFLFQKQPAGVHPVGTPSEIYAAHFNTPPASSVRGTGKPWFAAYAAGDFNTAARLLESEVADPATEAPSEAYLYLGISRLALGRPQEALQALEKVGTASFDWSTAQWYSALAWLKLDRPELAKPILERIAGQARHTQRNDAQQILNDLNAHR